MVTKHSKRIKRESLVKNIQTFDVQKCTGKSCLHASLVELKMKKAHAFKELEKFCTYIFPLQKKSYILQQVSPFHRFPTLRESKTDPLRNTAVGQGFTVFTPAD